MPEHSEQQPRKPLPFGTDIWTTKPDVHMGTHVSISIYGPKRARLYAGEPSHDYLWIQIGDHTRLDGPTYCWEEFAEVLNEALRQRRLYRERIEGPRPDAQRETER